MPASSLQSGQTIHKPYNACIETKPGTSVVDISLQEGVFEGSKWQFAPREDLSHAEGSYSLLYQPLCPIDFKWGTDEVRLLTADNESYFPPSVRDILGTKAWQTHVPSSDWTLMEIKVDLPRTETAEDPGQSTKECMVQLVFDEPVSETPCFDYIKRLGLELGEKVSQAVREISQG